MLAYVGECVNHNSPNANVNETRAGWDTLETDGGNANLPAAPGFR